MFGFVTRGQLKDAIGSIELRLRKLELEAAQGVAAIESATDKLRSVVERRRKQLERAAQDGTAAPDAAEEFDREFMDILRARRGG
jgi:hypothetical protein